MTPAPGSLSSIDGDWCLLVAHALTPDGVGSDWCLLAVLIVVAVATAACTFLGQWEQCLVPAHASRRGSSSLHTPETARTAIGACAWDSAVVATHAHRVVVAARAHPQSLCRGCYLRVHTEKEGSSCGGPALLLMSP